VTALAATRLAAEGLALARGGRRLFEALSFELAPGELLLLLGPNGSGKSSLLRALLGLAPLASGRIALGDDARAANGRALCRVALYQGHAGAAKAELTARENLALAAALDGTLEHLGATTAPAALDGALSALGLERQADLETRRLSQGQRQRLQLARFALGLESPVRPLWLMDEPSAALDADGAAMLGSLLARHLVRGGAALVATHLPIAPDGVRTRTLHVDAFRPRRAARRADDAAEAAAVR
jgi:heme exporter protein A